MTDLTKVDDSSATAVKGDGGGRRALINGPEKLDIDEPMPTTTTTAAVTSGAAGRPRRRCLPCRCCTRFTAAVLGLALLSLVLAAFLVAAVVRLRLRPTTCDAVDDSGGGRPTDGPGRVLSNFADDGSPLPWTDIRLPPTVAPRSYALRLRVDPTRDWFNGAVDLDVTINDDTRMIVLHASSIDVDVNNIRITDKVNPEVQGHSLIKMSRVLEIS